MWLCCLLLAVAACQPAKVDIGSRGVQRMNFAVPGVLTDKTLDLNNPQAVARALRINLTGNPRQKLYDIVMSGPSSEGVVETRTIEIRVENIKQGSSIIYGVQGSHYEAPKVVKPAARKAGRQTRSK